jgi:NitT/TauT family transport system permease protein
LKRRFRIRPWLSVVGLLLLWELASRSIFNPRLIPPPSEVAVAYWDLLRSLELMQDIGASLSRILTGYAMGVGAGLILGMAMGRIRWAQDLLEPPLLLIRSIPPIGFVPLAMVWFGTGEAVKYVVIMYATMIIVTLTTAEGVRYVPAIQIRAARCLGATRWQVFTHVILPSALPFILNGMRLALGFAFMGVISAEIIPTNNGLGYMITQARFYIQTENLFVGLFTLGLIAALTDRLYRFLISRTLKRFQLERLTQR